MDYEHLLFMQQDTPATQVVGKPDPLKYQVGGDHYKKLAIQPAEYTTLNGIGHLAGDAIAYLTRYKDKNGREDLEKAIQSIRILIALEYPENPPVKKCTYATADGWIAWDGSSKHPDTLNPSDMVTIKMRDGTKFTDRAGNIHWNWTGNDDDAVSYKLA